MGNGGLIRGCNSTDGNSTSEEVRHASRNADSACPFLPSRQYKKGHADSAFRDACRTSSDSTYGKSLVWDLGLPQLQSMNPVHHCLGSFLAK